jgi:hypothetical protein
MLKFRDDINRIVLMLGALFFLFISSNLQACVLAGGDCVNMQQAQSQMAEMSCHAPAPDDSHIEATNAHSPQTSAGHSDDDCCQLIPADLVNIANAQVSSSSTSQLSPQWFHLHFASLSSVHYIGFAQREIISPPPEFSRIIHSTSLSSVTVGRAPPSPMLA